ncbi:serine protease [Desulfosarcina widdelii]|uniref:Serine protease n=1 Tax=Desulfosarcina widdelii TaxID=947919 RepID=A0A5K7YWP2_9BACT|nr:nodulation protein NfeD [Desulfosarcina widdelii]BBO72750.1 serine protease [Desulfosarcina widdelii]
MNKSILIALPLIAILSGVLLGPPFVNPATAGSAPVYLVRLTGAVSPANADFLESAIRQANAGGAGCLIVMLDTPGGLAESMRRMVMAIYASNIPVVVYVSPSGARAASAGVMITMAADVAAMAPGTHIGAAHPVNAGGKDLDKTMSEKVINDMVAFIKSIAEKRGRNIQWAEKAVRESVSITETEALENKTIDLVARDVDALIDLIDGLEIAGKGRIDIDKAQRVFIDESLRTRVLKALSDPNIAYILMMIGLAGLYFELSHPGVVLPGVVGSIALILAFYSFQTLPVNIAGVLLIVLALIFFIMEMKIASYGLLSVAGVVSLLLGSVMLFDRGIDGQPGISWSVLMPTLVLVSGFFVGVAGLVFRSRRCPPMTGDSGLIGKTGVVKTALDPMGRIQVHGELWFARSRTPVAVGQTVRVVAVDGLTLEVEPDAPE